MAEGIRGVNDIAISWQGNPWRLDATSWWKFADKSSIQGLLPGS